MCKNILKGFTCVAFHLIVNVQLRRCQEPVPGSRSVGTIEKRERDERGLVEKERALFLYQSPLVLFPLSESLEQAKLSGNLRHAKHAHLSIVHGDWGWYIFPANGF